MKDLDKFVALWEETKDIEKLISTDFSLPGLEDIQTYLSSLPEDKHKAIRNSLDNALQALSAYTSKMEQEAGKLKEQIEQSVQASNACLVYNKAPREPRD